ncbi:DUF1569 domain-containing protein [Thalassotalea euphylliae]|uniref:DUF1569 domain-containing protein n=1 Tax=Thalassotalea euphylliae TaxID=1655234 RepID=UPI00362E09DA
MNRRTFITSLSVLGISGITGYGVWQSIDTYQKPLSFAELRKTLMVLAQHQINTTGAWNLAQILTHCAQSIEMSITGFPEHKSAVFKNTLGVLAFSAFDAKGRMHHGLSEPIPGAAPLEANAPLGTAYKRLDNAIKAFDTYQGKLAPHFAYGELSKQQYERAHVMHFNNHLSEIVTTAV